MTDHYRLSPQFEESAQIIDRFTRFQFQAFEELQAEKLLSRLQKDDAPFSLARTVVGLSRESLHKKDRAYLEKVAERNGVPFDQQRPISSSAIWPWPWLAPVAISWGLT